MRVNKKRSFSIFFFAFKMFTFSEYVVLLWSNEWKGLWIHSEYVYKHRKWNGIWLLGFYAMCYWVQQIVYTYKVRFEQHEQKKNKCMSGVSDYLKKNRYPYVWRKKYQLKWWLWVDVIGWIENKGGRFFLVYFRSLLNAGTWNEFVGTEWI